ncbi:YfhO family protein [bacterium]|nr:YfhO family protein [bacterium]MBU1754586.1 YfhO family protein [bacterium]
MSKKKKHQEQSVSSTVRDTGSGIRMNPDWFVFPCLLILSILFFQKAMDDTRLLSGGDITNYLLYLRSFVAQTIKDGIIPLWNPCIFSGVPCAAGMQPAIFYPLNLVIFTILPPHMGITWSAVIHLFLSGCFSYMFMKALKCHWLSSLTTALIFMFSGFQITHLYAGHACVFSAGIWLPLILFSIEKTFQTMKFSYVFLGSLAIGIQFLSGHPQISFYTYLLSGIYALFSLGMVILNKEHAKAVKLLPLLGMMGGISACIACIQIFPTLELPAYSSRSEGTGYVFNTFSSFPFENIFSFFFPMLFGNSLDIPYWGRGLLHEVCGYVGIIPLILAIAAIASKKNAHIILFSVMALVSLLLSFGKYTVMYKLCYEFIPGFDLFRVPGRMMYLWTFCLAVLAGLGSSSLIEQANKRQVILFSQIFCVFGILAMLISFFIAPDTWRSLIQASYGLEERIFGAPDLKEHLAGMLLIAKKSMFTGAVFLLLGAMLLYMRGKEWGVAWIRYLIPAIILVDLWMFCSPYITTIDSSQCEWDRNMVDFLKADKDPFRIVTMIDDASLNRGMSYGIANIGGYSPTILKRYQEFINISQGLAPETPTVVMRIAEYSRLLDLLNAKYFIVPSQNPIFHPQFKLAFSDSAVNIYQNRNCMKSAWIVHNFRVVNGRDAIFKAIKEIVYTDEVILEEKPTIKQGIFRGKVEASPEIIRHSPNEIIMNVGMASNGFLVLSEVFYPGWKAIVDGEEQKIYQANYILRAIELKKGTHTVRVVYDPPWLKWSIIISLFTGCFVVGVLVWKKVK